MKQGSILYPDRRQLPAPHTATVQAQEIWFDVQAERRPMAEENRVVAIASIGERNQGRCPGGASLGEPENPDKTPSVVQVRSLVSARVMATRRS